MTKRYKDALAAFNSPRFKFAVSLLIVLQELDNDEYQKRHDGIINFNMSDVSVPDEPDDGGISPEKRRLFDSLDARLLHTDQLTGENRRPVPIKLNKMALDALDDATCDALMIIMYAGRSLGRMAFTPDLLEFRDRYSQGSFEDEFHEWWNYLNMDSEDYARNIMAEKWPLDRYLRAGMHMFRIDER